MKCPKCHYLGFDTGERCKNCGYDFSLSVDQSHDGAGASAARSHVSPESVDWFREEGGDDRRELPDLTLRPDPTAATAESPALPLFRDAHPDDVPLVTVGAPRPPVAVRRTPEAQRARLTPTQLPAPSTGLPSSGSLMQESVFEFATEGSAPTSEHSDDELPDPAWQLTTSKTSAAPVMSSPVVPASAPAALSPTTATASTVLAGIGAADQATVGTLRPRLLAACIDFALLLAIDVLVIHFTLRVAGLGWSDLRALPVAPLATFLLSLKVAYLAAFTLSGGQTIGKMATHLQVVADDDPCVTGKQALQRALVELASVAVVGLPFLLALRDPDGRGLHDRLAGTRVVPSVSLS